MQIVWWKKLTCFQHSFEKKTFISFIKKANEKIQYMCKTHAIIFFDNGNISDMDLYQDELHLLERGKCLLATNFIYV